MSKDATGICRCATTSCEGLSCRVSGRVGQRSTTFSFPDLTEPQQRSGFLVRNRAHWLQRLWTQSSCRPLLAGRSADSKVADAMIEAENPVCNSPPAAFPRGMPPWRSSPTPSCGTCPVPVRAALRRASPCAGTLRGVLPPHAKRACTPQAWRVRWRVAVGLREVRSRDAGAEMPFEFPIREWFQQHF